MSKTGIIENALMAMYAASNNKSKKSLNEEDPAIGDEAIDFSEFDKYFKSVFGDLKKIIQQLESLEPIKNSEIAEKLNFLLKGMSRYPKLIRSEKYDSQDPNNDIAKAINESLNSLLMNLISLDGALKAMSEFSISIIKAFGGESEYNMIMKENFIHRNRLSILFEIKSPEEYPPGSLAKMLALINQAKQNKLSENPLVKKYNSDEKFKATIDELLGSYQKTYEATTKNAGNYQALEKEINSRFRSFFASKTLGGQMKELFSAVKGFFTDPIKAKQTQTSEQSKKMIVVGEDILGTSLQEADGPLLLLSPTEIVNLYQGVTKIIEKAKRPIGIFRDQIAFGGADEERIENMVDAGKNEAMPYLKDKEKLMEPEDTNPLAAAMISSDYFGENIHRGNLSSLLFEDAEEFVSLYNLEKSPLRSKLSKKSQNNIDDIFPKLAGKLVGSDDPDEIIIDPALEESGVDTEELEKQGKIDPNGVLGAIAALQKAKKAKLNTEDPDKLILEPIDKKNKESETDKDGIDTDEAPYSEDEWIKILKDEMQEEGYPPDVIKPLAKVLADDNFQDAEKTKQNLKDSRLPFEVVLDEDGEPEISYNKQLLNTEANERNNFRLIHKSSLIRSLFSNDTEI